MGRKTFESLPVHLTGRHVIVLSRKSCIESVFVPEGFARDLPHALALAHATGKPVWIAGGGEVYAQALRSGVVDFIDMTVVPRVEKPPTKEDVLFPLSEISHGFRLEGRVRNENDSRLGHHLYVRTG